jgi:ferrochelatase
VRHVQVVCPGFSADCLETIEEIGIENRDYFLEAGGERYEYIPCLNASDPHLDFITELAAQRIAPWMESPVEDCANTARLAEALKTRSAA